MIDRYRFFNYQLIMAQNDIFDKIGKWSEIKHEIIEKYAKAYSRIMAARPEGFFHIYIDAFAGAGYSMSRSTHQLKKGSPLIALTIEPPFKYHYFIEFDAKKADQLRQYVKDRKDVEVLSGDCNELLVTQVFPKVQWREFKRALCLLDPYSIDLDWNVISAAAKMKSMEIFLSFQIMDANRNVLWDNPTGVDERQKARFDRIWGDRTWQEVAYERDLFNHPTKLSGNERICKAFKKRLADVAGFEYVADPIPMKTDSNSPIYYLFFASHKPVAKEIVSQIFDKYR